MRPAITFLLGALLACGQCNAADNSPGTRDGEVRTLENGTFVAWVATDKVWLDPLAFWKNFAERGRGRNWPSDSSYPRYADVNENDAFLVQTRDGPCLMYFWHTRWRRANDVWRWGDEFNAFGGCAGVFD